MPQEAGDTTVVSFRNAAIGILCAFSFGFIVLLETKITSLEEEIIQLRNILLPTNHKEPMNHNVNIHINSTCEVLDAGYRNYKFEVETQIAQLEQICLNQREETVQLRNILEPMNHDVNIHINRIFELLDAGYRNYKLEDSMVFDYTSLHRKIFMAKNKRMIRNTYFTDAIAGPGSNPLLLYKGVLANIRITKTSSFKFRFKVQYQVVNPLSAENLIFSVALGTRTEIEKRHEGSVDCWKIRCAASISGDTLELETDHDYEYNLRTVSPTSSGSSATLSIEVQINGEDGTITYNDYDTGKHLHTFNGVNFTSPLIPAFSLFNNNKVHSQLLLF